LFVRLQGNVPVGNRELWKRGAIAFPREPWNNRLWQLLEEEISTRQKESAFETLPEEIEEIVVSAEEEILKLDIEEEILEPGEAVVDIVEEKMPSEMSTSQPAIEDRPANVYEAVLPFILHSLEQPLEDKALAERLNVEVVRQIKDWLQTAMEEGKVIKNKSKPVTYLANQPAMEYGPRGIYEAVLPFILRNLEQPLDHKTLAERLEIKPRQTQIWLKRAVEEGKVIKNKNPVTYVANPGVNRLW
ncbi:MAG: hypothetical protein F6K35_45825, partial [Okeania sp. SIO2H7]|nr:hypothetical protein [Okeania sp. SIO2H7]